jgi:hypothetical protein
LFDGCVVPQGQAWAVVHVEVEEAIRPRIGNGVVGFDEAQGVDCIADMSMRP